MTGGELTAFTDQLVELYTIGQVPEFKTWQDVNNYVACTVQNIYIGKPY